MREKTLILHGWGGSDFPHWQSWLAGEIAKDYGEVYFPLLDNPHFPTKKRWMEQVQTILDEFQPEVVICHSMANSLWFHLCEETQMRTVNRLLLVCPPRNDLDLQTIKTFFPAPVPAKLYAKEVMLVTSTNDPYLDQDEAKKMQIALSVPMKVIQNGGHMNEESNYGEWPWVLEWYKKGSSI